MFLLFPVSSVYFGLFRYSSPCCLCSVSKYAIYFQWWLNKHLHAESVCMNCCFHIDERQVRAYCGTLLSHSLQSAHSSVSGGCEVFSTPA